MEGPHQHGCLALLPYSTRTFSAPPRLEHCIGRKLNPGECLMAFIRQAILKNLSKGQKMERLAWLPLLFFLPWRTNPFDIDWNPELEDDFQSQPRHVLWLDSRGSKRPMLWWLIGTTLSHQHYTQYTFLARKNPLQLSLSVIIWSWLGLPPSSNWKLDFSLI